MKLVDDAQLDSDLGDIADAIRAKTGGSSQIAFPSGFVSGIGGLADPSGITSVASDVASGKIFMQADGTLGTGTASGGGGASNVVQGTFKGTTAGSVLEVSMAYTGSGYPIAVMIWPEAGYSSSDSWYSTIQRYAIVFWSAFKTTPGTAPTHPSSGASEPNVAFTNIAYKSSTSTGSTVQRNGGLSSALYVNLDPSSSSSGQLAVRFRTDKKMYVYIASNSYGFAKDITYKYLVVYSS